MRNGWTWVVCCAALTIGFCVATPDAQARPAYFGLGKKMGEEGFPGYATMYPKVAKEATEAKCNICHFGDKKTNRNDYGKAVGEALGGKNITDIEKVKAALKKAEEGKSATEGKTFGDLLKDGKLPGKEPK